jgi:ADP-ribose pyrophosphatase
MPGSDQTQGVGTPATPGEAPASDEPLRERPVERRTVFEGRLLTLHADTVLTAAGARASREVVDHPGAVGVIATDDAGRVLLVRQWRHAVGRALWEIPAGTLVPGETPAAAARRELAEETGYTAASWRRLGAGPVAPGYSGEILHLYSAGELTPGEPHTDPDENVVARLFSATELADLAGSDALDVKTYAGLWLAGIDGVSRPRSARGGDDGRL